MRVKRINMREVTSDFCLSLVCIIILVQEVDCVSKKRKVKFLHLEAVNVTLFGNGISKDKDPGRRGHTGLG